MDNKLTIFTKESIISRIKNFFYKCFKKTSEIEVDNKQEIPKNINSDGSVDVTMMQKQYRTGNLDTRKLTSEQVIKMCKLYDKQINDLKRQNESKKKRLLKYRENLKAN